MKTIETQNYHEILMAVNEDVKYLMRKDVAEEVPYHLEKFGFTRINESSSDMGFSGKGFRITYNPTREEPFMLELQKEDEKIISKANKILERILLEVLEDI